MNKKQLIKDRLRALFPKANLSSKRMDAIADKLETEVGDTDTSVEVDALLNQINSGLVSFEDIARQDDRVRVLEAKIGKGAIVQPKETDEPPKETHGQPNDDVTAMLREIMEGHKTLAAQVLAITKEKTVSSKKTEALKMMEASEILKGMKPEVRNKWVNRLDLSVEDVSTQIKDLEEEYATISQSFIDATSFAGSPPHGAGKPKTLSKEEADRIAQSLV